MGHSHIPKTRRLSTIWTLLLYMTAATILSLLLYVISYVINFRAFVFAVIFLSRQVNLAFIFWH